MDLSLNVGIWVSFVICELPFVPLKAEKKKKNRVYLELRKKNPTKSKLTPWEQSV